MTKSATPVRFQPPFPPKRSFFSPFVVAIATAALLLVLAAALVLARGDRTPSAFEGGGSAPVADRIFFAEAHLRALRDGTSDAFLSGYRDGAAWTIEAPVDAAMPTGEWGFPEGVGETLGKLEQRFRFATLSFLAPISLSSQNDDSVVAAFRMNDRSGTPWEVRATIRTDIHGAIREERWEISSVSAILEGGEESPEL